MELPNIQKCIDNYNPLLYKLDETVATKYNAPVKTFGGYVSEAQMEENFIKLLVSLGYEYKEIHTSKDLIDNLRIQIEKLNINEEKGLNGKPFSDNEWEKFYNEKIANPSLGVLEKTQMIQESYIQELIRDNGDLVNIKIFDKYNLSNNYLQVINQYEGNNVSSGAKYNNRYDVTILVNGLPLVHNELKKRGVALKEAYNQIDRYQRDSFWADTGLYEYIQIFIISNGANTRYYANTLREKQIGVAKKKKIKHSTFGQTSTWADGENTPINDLDNFAMTFLAPSVIRKILGKYCVFDTERNLKVMRPYQIYATEQIIHNVDYINKNNKWGTFKNNPDGSFERPGGFIWHATGSGKTLTSFKTAALLSETDMVDAVIFAVDRKDLSYQTEREYNKFKKGSVNSTKNTAILLTQLEECANGSEQKIIVTTIQKLHHLVRNNKFLKIYKKNVVFIFDECHRSQFGNMHSDIVKTFKNFAVYGFTGTPIFDKNCKRDKGDILTTERIFGKALHKYITIDAINDGNVLPWKWEVYKTFDEKILHDETVSAIDKEKILYADKRITDMANQILTSYNRLTHRGQEGGNFCEMLVTDSIKEAKIFFLKFLDLQKEKSQPLKIATIFTAAANEDDEELSEDPITLEGLDKNSLDFLNETALKHYNSLFGTSFTTSSFDRYYSDLSRRVRGTDDDGNRLPLNECVDLVIVVDMLITGFDAPRLNTIWLDRNLKYQKLIQTISRVNRLFGALKTFGNVCTFRDITDNLNDAIELFCNKDAKTLVCLRTYEEYLNGYETEENGKPVHNPGIREVCWNLRGKFPAGSDKYFDMATTGNDAKKEFIKLFNQYLKLNHIIQSFDEFEKNKNDLKELNLILKDEEFDTYKSKYQDIRETFLNVSKSLETNVLDDIVFEIGLLKQFDVDVDYILNLIKEMATKKSNVKEIKAKALKIVDGSTKLRSKRELIELFIEKINGHDSEIEKIWVDFTNEKFNEEVNELIQELDLKKDETFKLLKDILSDDTFDVRNSKLKDLSNKKISLRKNKNSENTNNIRERLQKLHEKYFGLIGF